MLVLFEVVREAPGTFSVEVDGLAGEFRVVGPPAPAAFRVSGLSVTPSEVEPEEDVEVSVTVSNEGGESGSYTLDLILDGEVVESRTFTLSGGDSATETFTLSSGETGQHVVDVEGLLSFFWVIRKPALSPSPTPSPPSPPPSIPKIPWTWILIVGLAVAVIIFFLYMRGKFGVIY